MIRRLICAHPDAICELDRKHHTYPFMLAAADNECQESKHVDNDDAVESGGGACFPLSCHAQRRAGFDLNILLYDVLIGMKIHFVY